MTLLAILYWLILILSVVFQFVFHYAYTMHLALLALFIIIGLKIFRTPLQ
jgi:hypothetical protein